ncbi:MAG TPA: alpha/beta fold hydrolase [Candidatus Nanoarchaeia archaeon]|nr:alpha/beta fold hydrolase [Candidatus Nanoarchaeia archaeon]
MPKLEQLLQKAIMTAADAAQISKQIALSFTSPKELLAILQDIATHADHFVDGKKSKRWKKSMHNPALLLHGYFQNDSALAGINIDMTEILGGKTSLLYKVFSTIMSIIDDIEYGELKLTEKTLRVNGLEDYLFNRGIPVDRPSHGFYRNLDAISEELIQRAERIIAKQKGKVDIVGHSLGGLVAIYAAITRPDLFQRAVAIAAPYRGTIMANIAYRLTLGLTGKSAEQMREGSEFIRKLNEMEVPENVIIYSFMAEYDALVPNLHSSQLDDRPNVVNKLIKGIGHVGAIGPEIFPYVHAALTDNIKALKLGKRKKTEVQLWLKSHYPTKPALTIIEGATREYNKI